MPYRKFKFHPTKKAGNSPNVTYVYEKADPLIGILELSSAYMSAVMRATKPEMIKLMKREGPAYYAAIPVNANIPAPIVPPMPNIV